MKRLVLSALLTLGPAEAIWAADAGFAKGAAAYLNFSLGARAISMGQTQAAILPSDASALYSNPAGLADLPGQSLTTTSGLLGLDRSLYFAGYALPFHTKPLSEDTVLDLDDSDLHPGRSLGGSKKDGDLNDNYELLRDFTVDPGAASEKPAAKKDKTTMAVAAGMTYFGIQNIEGRSEFGAPEGDFQDGERAIYLSYAAKVYPDFGIGFSGKYLGQTLQSASAHGLAFDVGTTYHVPVVRQGRLDLAFVAKDLGGSLKWKVPDPTLDTEFSYKEPVLSKLVFGTAYTSPSAAWIWALDLMKVNKQKLQPNAGLEWNVLSFLHLRGGANNFNPSAGFGIDWKVKSMKFRLDYAYQYDLEDLVNPSWITLSLQFLPSK